MVIFKMPHERGTETDMRILRDASEEEMVLTFLREELDSRRFREEILKTLTDAGAPEELILEGDITSERQNILRNRVLGLFRGYPNRDIFENYPRDIVWKYAIFEAVDLDRLRYVDYSYWNELSKGTSSPVRAAESIRKGEEIYGLSNQYFLDGKEMLEQGGTFPPLIVLTCGNEKYLILEGHCRATAYALVPKAFEGTEAYVGFCSAEALLRKAPKLIVRADEEEK